MSTGNWPQDGNQPSNNPPPKKSSSGLKVVLILLGVGGGLLLLCCGGFAFLGYRVSKGITMVPAEIQARTQEIAKIEIPARFTPAMGMKFDIPGVPSISMVIYIAGGGDGSLLLMNMAVPFEQANAGNMSQQMRQQMNQQQQKGNEKLFRELNVTESKEEEFQIGGKAVKVEFVTGTDKDTGDPYKQATTVFPGKTGTSTVLIIQLPEDDWNDEEVRQMIQSIQTP